MRRARRLVLTAFLTVLLAPHAPAGGLGSSAPWRALTPQGTWTPTTPAPPRACPALHLPSTWDVRASVLADVTGDRTPECVLAVWRPWRNWPVARWSAHPTPITPNRDARGDSAHVAVLRPLPGGRYRELWVGSALHQPVTTLTVRPDGTLVTLETTYRAGRAAAAHALSEWRWTGFGFRLLRRVPTAARALTLDPLGRPTVR